MKASKNANKKQGSPRKDCWVSEMVKQLQVTLVSNSFHGRVEVSPAGVELCCVR